MTVAIALNPTTPTGLGQSRSASRQARTIFGTPETRRTADRLHDGALAQLGRNLTAIERATDRLAHGRVMDGLIAARTGPGGVSAALDHRATVGSHTVIVTELALAQVTASSSHHPDADATVVASGGTLTIGGAVVTVSGAVTLQGLADAVNATDGIGVAATVSSANPGDHQLVLTGTRTGAAHGFTITNALTGGASPVTFLDTVDADGISGDQPGDNTVRATDATLVVDGVTVSSASNTVRNVIPGVTLTLLTAEPTSPVGLTIRPDLEPVAQLVRDLVDAYNGFLGFLAAQSAGSAVSLRRDGVTAGLLSDLADATRSTRSTDGSLRTLSDIGIHVGASDELAFDEQAFDAATAGRSADLEALLSGSGGQPGALAALDQTVERYVRSGALVPGFEAGVSTEARTLGARISHFEARLGVRRAVVRGEATTAASAAGQLSSQMAELSRFRLRLTLA